MHKCFFSVRFLLLLLLLVAPACFTDVKGLDIDGDEWSVLTGDCWDSLEQHPPGPLRSEDLHPGADDEPYDGIDANCDKSDDYDPDGDGWVTEEQYFERETIPGIGPTFVHHGWGDCNDSDPEIHPGADELCDGVDNNCDGEVDEDCPSDDTAEDTGHSDTGE